MSACYHSDLSSTPWYAYTKYLTHAPPHGCVWPLHLRQLGSTSASGGPVREGSDVPFLEWDGFLLWFLELMLHVLYSCS